MITRTPVTRPVRLTDAPDPLPLALNRPAILRPAGSREAAARSAGAPVCNTGATL